MKRQKIVKDVDSVAHDWAHQSQDEARNPHGNFYFRGEVIYSYGSHFPIARIYTDKKGKKIVFFTLRNYSNTTSKHIWAVRSACSHLDKLYMQHPITQSNPFDKRDWDGLHKKNIAHWVKSAEQQASNLPSARKPEKYLSAIQSLKSDLDKYLAFFKLKLSAQDKKVFEIGDGKQYVEMLKKFAKADKEREARNRKAASKLFVKYRELYHAWADGDTFSEAFTDKQRTLIRQFRPDETLLRISLDGTEVVTEKNVKIPIAVAQRIYKKYCAIVQAGGCDGDCDYKILNYDVEKMNESLLQVGCHSVSRTEIDYIANQLNF